MENIPFFLIARLLLGLVAGIWLARKLRGFLRWLVLRLMPLRYRVSERSFNIQSRASAVLAYALALGIALSVYAGLGKAREKIALPWVAREETTEISSHSLEPPLPPAYSAPAYSPPEKAPPPQDSMPPAGIIAPPPPEPPPAYPSAYEERGRHFVQLYAFRDEARAWAQKQYWQGRLSRQVWVGVAPGEAAPFKVLVGPFAQLQDARRFLRSERLDGFPREQRDIRLYED